MNRYDLIYNFIQLAYKYSNCEMTRTEYIPKRNFYKDSLLEEEFELVVDMSLKEMKELLEICKEKGSNYIETYMMLK